MEDGTALVDVEVYMGEDEDEATTVDPRATRTEEQVPVADAAQPEDAVPVADATQLEDALPVGVVLPTGTELATLIATQTILTEDLQPTEVETAATSVRTRQTATAPKIYADSCKTWGRPSQHCRNGSSPE
jgi:hypothetical protein